METKITAKKVKITKLEKQFIIAYYESVADTLNFSKMSDVAGYMEGLTIKQVKGVFGSLVNKGIFKPDADTFNANDENYETIGMTDLLSGDEMQAIAKEVGCYFDFEDIDYDYLKRMAVGTLDN